MSKEQIRTVCTLDCPDACGLLVTVANGAVVRIKGDPEHPVTKGFTCSKIARYPGRVLASERRVVRPLLRQGERFVEISYDDAYAIIGERVREAVEEHGWETVFFYHGLGSTGASALYTHRFFNSLPAYTTFSGSICGAAGIAGQTADFGYRRSHHYQDCLNSDVIIFWGRNPAVTAVHLFEVARAARTRGARLITIDPVRTKTADNSDLWIRISPDGDRFLIAYLLKRILSAISEAGDISYTRVREGSRGFEEFARALKSLDEGYLLSQAGVVPEYADELSRIFASEARIGIWPGWGLQRHTHGGLVFRLLDALSFVTGNSGVEGGGVNHGFDEWRFFDVAFGGTKTRARTVPIGLLARDIPTLDPPVDVFFVAGANPVSQLPKGRLFGELMRQARLSVVVDGLMTETAARADIILPVSLMFETDDVVGSYGHNVVGRARRCVAPPEGVVTDTDVVNGVADALGISGFAMDREHVLRAVARTLGRDGDDLAMGRRQYVIVDEDPVAYRDGYATPDGLFHFAEIPRDAFEPRPGGTTLLSTHYEHDMHSLGLAERTRNLIVSSSTHRDSGATALVRSEGGTLSLPAELSDRVCEDAVVLYEGGEEGFSANDLIEPCVTDIGHGVPFYSTHVSVALDDI